MAVGIQAAKSGSGWEIHLFIQVEVGFIDLLAGPPPCTECVHQIVGQRNKLVVLVQR